MRILREKNGIVRYESVVGTDDLDRSKPNHRPPPGDEDGEDCSEDEEDEVIMIMSAIDDPSGDNRENPDSHRCRGKVFTERKTKGHSHGPDETNDGQTEPGREAVWARKSDGCFHIRIVYLSRPSGNLCRRGGVEAKLMPNLFHNFRWGVVRLHKIIKNPVFQAVRYQLDIAHIGQENNEGLVPPAILPKFF